MAAVQVCVRRARHGRMAATLNAVVPLSSRSEGRVRVGPWPLTASTRA